MFLFLSSMCQLRARRMMIDAQVGLTNSRRSHAPHWVAAFMPAACHSSEYLRHPVFQVSFQRLCRVHIMTDYGDHLQPSRAPSLVQPAADTIRRSLTRNSYYSHNSPSVNVTTRSWVHSQQNTPGPPSLPLPIPLPTPVQPLRSLPNPHARQRRPPVLYTVNPSEPLDSEEDQQRLDNIRLGLQKAGPSKLRRKPPASIHSSVHNVKDKKPTVLGGLVKSIRRISKIIRYGGKGARSKGTLGTDREGTTGGSLPQYTSNPPTPIVAPIPSRPHHYAHQPMEMQIPTTVPVLGSSPPEVVRLDDVRRCQPGFRIMPPSINIARSETAHFFPGTTNNTDSSSSAANTAERTTVMLYNHDHHTPTPTPPLSRQVSSNGPPGRLSYVGSEQVVRPTSFHGGSQAPPPIEIPTSITRMGTPASYLSYVSQPTSVPLTRPLHVKRSSSQLRSQLSHQSQQQHQSTSPPQHQSSSTPPIIESSERIQSPVSAHPQPTTDYLKMALSPTHPQHHTTALTNLTSATHPSSSGITSFSYDPSFSKPSGPIERFFKTLYYMPWIAYERITVDYLPGKIGRVHGHALSRETSGKGVRGERRRRDGDGRRRETRDRHKDKWRRKPKRTRADRGDGDERIASWYRGVSSRSKRTSAELDLLSSDLGLHSSSTTTTGTGAAMGLGLENLPAGAASPRSPLVSTVTAPGNERERRQRGQKENVGDKQEQTSHSRRHHHRQDPHNRHHGRQRRKVGSGSPDDDEDEGLNQSPSPLIPLVYPLHYPPYPYPYPYTFTIPSSSGPHAQSRSQSHPHPPSPPSETPNEQTQSRNHRGPRSRPSQPVFYSPGIPHPGYTAPANAYQPMIAPSTSTMMAPQVYLLRSNSRGQLQPLSPSGPIQNGSGVIGGGPEVLVDAVDSGQQ